MTLIKTKTLSDEEMAAKRDEVMAIIHANSAIMNISLGSIVDISDAYMTDCIEEMRKIGIYRHRIKQMVGRTKDDYKALRRAFWLNTQGSQDLYMDLLDIINDEVRPDVDKLFYPIKLILDRNGDENTVFLAKLIVTLNIMRLACISYDALLKLMEEQTHMRMGSVMAPVNPHMMADRWADIVNIFLPTMHTKLQEVAEDPIVNRAVEIISKKLTTTDFMERHCQKAMEQNPELEQEYYANHPEEQ